MDLLARREHTRWELRRKLEERGFANEMIEQVLDALTLEGLQSDTRFAEGYVTHRTGRGYGPLRIIEELKTRGVDGALISEYINKNDPEWGRRIGAVRTKHFGVEWPKDARERARQSRFLYSRGFTGEQIQRLMRQGDEFGDEF
jgi:regulatory protein